MKKRFEMPDAAISMFHTENIVTASGNDNVTGMQSAMAGEGYTPTTKELGTFFE